MNLIIKKREDFRPFAPSILEEFASEWYENYIPSPYMSFVSKIKKGKEKIVQAVTHADGTGRIQTVNKNINQDYYDLIKKFYEITSVPMILNTSLNDNEPIIESPENAINLFINNQIDTLLLENYLLTK
jgi:carbamoyltransferase